MIGPIHTLEAAVDEYVNAPARGVIHLLPAELGPKRHPVVPVSVVPECSLSWSTCCLKDSIATPDRELEIHATACQVIAGANTVG